MINKTIGVIVEVNDQYSKVGVYNLVNDTKVIWRGEILSGIKVGAYLTVNQNDIRIIASVVSEKIIDQQNTVQSEEFDNRFHKNSINRVIELKTKGVIENHEFKITSKYVPMIGNEVTLTTQDELKIVYGLKKNEKIISIGKTVLEEYSVQIPINRFFASHIGIFGNTGSGKSNTLHKLYLELFRSKQIEKILSKSKFYIIDFNGEYCGNDMFGVSQSQKHLLRINTRLNSDKLDILSNYLFDADILSLLFDARPATQVPFLKKAISQFSKIGDENHYARFEIGLLKSILKTIKGPNNIEHVESWILAARNNKVDESLLEKLITMGSEMDYGNSKLRIEGIPIIENGLFQDEGIKHLRLDEIEKKLSENYSHVTKLKRFLMFLEFQRVFEIFHNSTKADFINPLFNRIRPAIESLDKVINIIDKKDSEEYPITIISLLDANKDISRLLPMLLSKMIYDEHKKKVQGETVQNTTHLIIDEAHNILNSQHKSIGDDWQDYRLSIFEEIIKEGRKFGFYLTLSSQRPADISPTIMSQLHNYVIHRLVNDKDLSMLENTMPTLDLFTYKTIPMLGQGEAIITGTAFKIPILVKVEKEETIRPNSDDVVLTELWGI